MISDQAYRILEHIKQDGLINGKKPTFGSVMNDILVIYGGHYPIDLDALKKTEKKENPFHTVRLPGFADK